jgi:branched-chain amino acid aminotransferase
MKHISLEAILNDRRAFARPFHENYYAFYSSAWGGLVTDPLLMVLPLDDHMVHRGDGVFEAFKCVEGRIYNMRAHLDRLIHSAQATALALPCSRDVLEEQIVEVVRAGGHRDCMVRVFVSRGPGGFGVDPYECAGPQLYIMVHHLKPPFMVRHPHGARVRTSRIPVKPPFFAAIKNCNYLPNVLMKKEAVDAGVDFTVSFDEQGHLGEGATENVGIVTPNRELLFPSLGGILQGTTMVRLMELAAPMVATGTFRRVAFEDLPRAAVESAAELLIVGTTINVVAGVDFDGRPVGTGRPGPGYECLSRLLGDDIAGNRDLQTPVW